MKPLLPFLLALALTAHAQRQQSSINHNWQFRLPTDTAWQAINLPHTYNGDAYLRPDYYRGPACYRRQMMPVEAGRRAYLRFDAASKAARVSLDGQPLATHKGGYTAFTIGVTDKIKPQSLLEVNVDNSCNDITPISADFTFWGGIYRDAWLITTDALHFDMANMGSDGIFISTPTVSEAGATVNIRAGVTNDSPRPVTLVVENVVRSPQGGVVATAQTKVKLAAGETRYVETLTPAIARPQLWSPESPARYEVTTRLIEAKTKRETDRLTHKIGFRTFAFDGEKGFFLNGKPYKLRGFNRHQDQAPYGVALSDEAHRRDISLMKDLGANFIRISHYPQDDALLDACDALGMIAWEEIPIVNRVPDTPQYADNCEINLREMIRQHYNHPAVIAWGYMNEILLTQPNPHPEILSPEEKRTVELASRLEKVLKSEDPSRVSVMAFNMTNRYNEIGLNLEDVAGWNLYHGWYVGKLNDFEAFCQDQHRRYPNHPIIISEWGAGSDRRIHSTAPRAFDFSIEYQQTYIEHYLPFIEQTPWISGCAYWNFIDFNCAARQESMPRVNNKGVFYNNRKPKDVAYYFKAMWRKDLPVCHIATRDLDAFQPASDSIYNIKIYANGASASLSIDGQTALTAPVNNCFALFRVKMSAGSHTLVAQSDAGQDATTIQVLPQPCIAKGDVVALNLGSNAAYTSTESGLTWLPLPANHHISGATPKSTTSECLLTPDGPLFQTWLEGPLSFTLPAPAGHYEVELLMADFSRPTAALPNLLGAQGTQAPQTDAATFSITLCGQTVEPAFTPAAQGRYRTAVTRRYRITTTTDSLTINLQPITGQPILAAIKLQKL